MVRTVSEHALVVYGRKKQLIVLQTLSSKQLIVYYSLQILFTSFCLRSAESTQRRATKLALHSLPILTRVFNKNI